LHPVSRALARFLIGNRLVSDAGFNADRNHLQVGMRHQGREGVAGSADFYGVL